MYKIDEKIKLWKNKLFDKTRNNEMLNVKTNKKKYVVIEEPSINEIYDKIVINDKTLSFREKITIEKNPRVFKTMALMTKLGYPMEAYKGDIAGISVDDLDKTLYNLKKDTDHYKNEFGVDILHLSFGYIIWKLNKDDAELSSTPLINVPVHIERKNINSPYIISKIGDPILNPALLYVLRDYKITLPPFDINKKIEEYFDLIEPIAIANNWNLIKSVGLNILKYQKIAMFVDLDNPGNVERIKNHKLLMAMSGDIPYEGISEEEMNDITNKQDEKSELNRILVLDADSSQLDALALADKGHSFVLFGPPGTGKSQTITNLIASALYKGKKVLFVAQKLAALEVVYNKLKQTRLSDFCLLLHDVKTKKKEVIEKIYKPLENIERTDVTEEAMNKLRELENLKKSINLYYKNTHEKILPIEQSLFELLNHYYDLIEIEDLSYSINNVLSISKTRVEEIINVIKQFEIEYNAKLEHPYEKWVDTNLTSITLSEKRKLEDELNQLVVDIEKIYLAFNEINHFIPEINLYIRDYYQYIDPIDQIFNTDTSHPKLFNKEMLNQNTKLIERQIELTNLIEDNKNNINKYFNHNIYKYNLIEFTNNFKKDINDIREHISFYALRDDDNLLTTITGYINCVKEYKKNVEALRHVVELIKSTFKLTDQDLINNNFKKILNIIKENEFDFKIHQNVKEYKKEFIQDLELVSKHINEKKLAYNELINIYGIEQTDKILKFDVSSIYSIYDIIKNTKSIKRTFNKKYKTAIKQLKTLFNIKKRKVIFMSLEMLYKYHYNNEVIKDQINYLNSKYHNILFDEETNFSEMLKLSENSVELLKMIEFENDEYFVRYLSSSNKSYLIKTLEEYIKINENINLCEVETTISKDSLDLDIILSDIIKEYQDVDNLFTKYRHIFNDFEKRFEIAKYFDLLITYQTHIDEFENNKNRLSLYIDDPKNYSRLLNSITGIKEFYRLVNKYNFNEENIYNILFNESKRNVILDNNKFLRKNLANVDNNILKLNEKFNNINFINMPLDQLFNYIYELNSSIEGLVAYLNYQNYRKNISDDVVFNFIEKIENSEFTHNLDKIFLKNFYYEVVENYIYNNSYLNKVSKLKIINEIEQFKTSCKQQLIISQSRIRSEIMKRIPRMDGIISEKDSRAILRKEHNKKSRIMPLRKLFDTIPDLLMQLQPCIMMSPIAVSSFLENDKYDFDLVIFDEASQIFPEDAIGTIYRGKQVIIAGDSNQLPPTSFFSKVGSDEFSEDIDDIDLIEEDTGESILDLATNSLINCSLKWHYRSKDERLIAFSNQKIYDNKLITFPTNYTTLPDYGVEFEYVEGGSYTNKGNVVEALRIVELIERHINMFPEKSLGVIAFSKKQQNCIEKEVNNFRKHHLEYEFFFNNDKEEPFFIKNLENVQGDERDVIIFSIGYAKGEDGVLRHNFGPLQIAGGERRLNVAISRSKLNIKVVSSIKASDINTKKIKSKGAILLKEYLRFAEDNSTLIEERTMSVEEIISKQKIQQEIAKFLTEQGFLVQTDYGYSNFKVDVAVLDKEDERNIICGILLDGRYYESDNTCRGREYLKQNILENNGWKVHRIWSYFWYKQNDLEKEKLLSVLNGEEKEVETTNEVELITEKVSESTESVKEYREYKFYKFVKMANPNIYIINAILIRNIVSVEQPIHIDRIVELICEQYGFDPRFIRPKVETYINTPAYKKDGKYVYFDASLLTKPRKNTYEKRIKFEHIYHGEIKAVMFDVIKNSFGLMREDLMKTVISVFGYKLLTPKFKVILSEIIDELISHNIITEIEGILSIKE